MSRFTENGPYPQMAKRWLDSGRALGLRLDLAPVPDAGAWNKNCHRKPMMILGKLVEAREPVCWVDVDCEFMSHPMELLNCANDFAILNWHAFRHEGLHYSYDPTRLLGSTGVVMFGYTAGALELLVRWCAEVNEHPNPAGDDPSLDIVFNGHRPPVNPLWLTPPYNRMRAHFPNVEPVINHHWEGVHSKCEPAA